MYTIPQDGKQYIQVGWHEYKGKPGVDVRLYAEINGQPTPLKKGIRLNPDSLPKVIEALIECYKEQVTNG